MYSRDCYLQLHVNTCHNNSFRNSLADVVWLDQPVTLKWLTKTKQVFWRIYRKVVISVDEQLQAMTI
jgi:hypothetical protein